MVTTVNIEDDLPLSYFPSPIPSLCRLIKPVVGTGWSEHLLTRLVQLASRFSTYDASNSEHRGSWRKKAFDQYLSSSSISRFLQQLAFPLQLPAASSGNLRISGKQAVRYRDHIEGKNCCRQHPGQDHNSDNHPRFRPRT